jgi:DNA-binding SARP family transcriptional activator
VQPITQIRLLGQFEVRVGDVVIPPLESVRAESVLAYLLLHRAVAVSRQRLALLFWPDSTDAQARTNLRHVLHTLRGRLPDADRHLEITPRTLRWRSSPPYRLDAAVFEQLLTPGATGPPVGDRETVLREAVGLYVGDLLEGCDDEWLLGERERLRLRLRDALAELAGLCEIRGEVAEAITHAERLLRDDPLREATYQQLMRLHAARGDRARALRIYHTCSSILAGELGVEPAAETAAAYEALLPRAPEGQPAVVAQVAGQLVGRRGERAQLVAVWRSTEAGHAQFVLVHGEPGVGKTRLVEDLRAWCARRGGATAEARCYAAEGALAYGPVIAWLRSEALRTRRHRLDRARLTELARLLPELLVETPDLEHPGALPESEQRHRMFEAVSAAVFAVTGPLLLVVDDVQHVDRETCQLLHFLLRIQPAARLLVVATARREDLDGDHPLQGLLVGLRARERLSEIELGPLSRAEATELAEALIGAALGDHDAHRLYRETEGNPLFVVEALRAGWTAGRPLSPRVQSVIAARLDQLSGQARDLVGVAATIGRDFNADVLAAAAGVDQDIVVRGLDELWRRRIIREQSGGAVGATYDFSHDKIRQVAYVDVSPARRRLLHLRIASVLERADTSDAGASQIAAHYDRAGATEQAVAWYRRAAAAAQQLHAGGPAVRQLNRALGLLRSMPPSAKRDAVELEVHTALLVPLISLTGYLSPALSASQQRARELTGAAGADPGPPLLRSLALSAMTSGAFQETTRFGHLLRVTGERDADDVLVVEAAYLLGIASFWEADFPAARRHFTRAVERYQPDSRRSHLLHYGQDPKVVCLSRLANTLWFLGEPHAAVEARSAALAWAEEIDHPLSRGIALTFAAVLALDMGNEQDLRMYVAQHETYARRPPHQWMAAAFNGYIAVLDGDTSAGVAAISAAVRRTRDEPAAPGQHAITCRILLAARMRSGDTAATLVAVDQLLDAGAASRVWEPLARRVRAELGSRS